MAELTEGPDYIEPEIVCADDHLRSDQLLAQVIEKNAEYVCFYTPTHNGAISGDMLARIEAIIEAAANRTDLPLDVEYVVYAPDIMPASEAWLIGLGATVLTEEEIPSRPTDLEGFIVAFRDFLREPSQRRSARELTEG